MHVPCTVWRECLAHSVSASPVALTPSVAPNRWHDPHTLASKEGESDVAISLWNGTPLVLHCRGGVAGQRMGSHQEAIHIHVPTIFSPSTKGGGLATLQAPSFQQFPWTWTRVRHLMLDLAVVNLQISLARTWSSCCFSTDFSRSRLLNILGNKSNLNFIIPSSALDTEGLDQ